MKAATKVVTIASAWFRPSKIAFVEPFDPAANSEFKPEKNFKSRVVLLDRGIVLAEQPAAGKRSARRPGRGRKGSPRKDAYQA